MPTGIGLEDAVHDQRGLSKLLRGAEQCVVLAASTVVQCAFAVYDYGIDPVQARGHDFVVENAAPRGTLAETTEALQFAQEEALNNAMPRRA